MLVSINTVSNFCNYLGIASKYDAVHSRTPPHRFVVQYGAFAPLAQVLQKSTQALQHAPMMALVIGRGEFLLAVQKRREPLVPFFDRADIETLHALDVCMRTSGRKSGGSTCMYVEKRNVPGILGVQLRWRDGWILGKISHGEYIHLQNTARIKKDLKKGWLRP